MAQLTVDEINTFLAEHFSELQAQGHALTMTAIGQTPEGHSTGQAKLAYQPFYLRPGGTISGPMQFLLVDVAMYGTLLAQIGPVALAVTANLTINFLSRAHPDDLICDVTIKKRGRRLAVMSADLYGAGQGPGKLVASASGTYAIPDITA